MDLKLWHELEDVFTEDATADYGTPSAGRPSKLGSRDEIVSFLRDSLGNDIITLSWAAADAMRAVQAGAGSAAPRHQYGLADFGLTAEQVDERFAGYLDTTGQAGTD